MTAVAGQKGFQLDLNLCTGCGACAVACAVENQLPWGTSWRWVETFNIDRVPGVPLHHLSLACNHCADAPCMKHCPALAYSKDPITGAVLLDQDSCIGCKYCTWACPYDAPRYRADQGVVAKCTFCHGRQLEGHSPACVSQCPTGALRFGDLDDLSGRVDAGGFPTTEARPSIRFVPLRPGEQAPAQPDEGPLPATASRAGAKTSLASEWPLVAFTLLSASLAGAMLSPAGRSGTALGAFVAGAALAGGFSSLHLGRKLRAWRAALNVRRSWLSREVVCFALFSGASAWHLSGWVFQGWSGHLTAILALCLLYSMDRVYDVTRSPGLSWHSARMLLTGMLSGALFAGALEVASAVVALKLLLYLGRKGRGGRVLGPGWVVLRIVAAAAGGAALLLGGAITGLVGAVALIAVGELVDRCEFYLELTVPSPARQIEQDLARAIAGTAGVRTS